MYSVMASGSVNDFPAAARSITAWSSSCDPSSAAPTGAPLSAPLASAPNPPLPKGLRYFSAARNGMKSIAPATAPPASARNAGFSTPVLSASGKILPASIAMSGVTAPVRAPKRVVAAPRFAKAPSPPPIAPPAAMRASVGAAAPR